MDVSKYLKPYSKHQKDNWKSSKKIVIFEDIQQLQKFIDAARAGQMAGKKLYFGRISKETAIQVEKILDLNIENFNCALYADNIRKIYKDHGDECCENMRGQRAVTYKDFFRIPEIIGDADEIRAGGYYNKLPVIQFKKDGITVVAVVSHGSLDLYTQTMYISKKNRSLATATDEQAPVYTS